MYNSAMPVDWFSKQNIISYNQDIAAGLLLFIQNHVFTFE